LKSADRIGGTAPVTEKSSEIDNFSRGIRALGARAAGKVDPLTKAAIREEEANGSGGSGVLTKRESLRSTLTGILRDESKRLDYRWRMWPSQGPLRERRGRQSQDV
jgi:hypothetical protein